MTFKKLVVVFLPPQDGRKSLFLYFNCIYISGENTSLKNQLDDVLATHLCYQLYNFEVT